MELPSEYNSNRRETIDFEEKETRSRVNTFNSESSENILRLYIAYYLISCSNNYLFYLE